MTTENPSIPFPTAEEPETRYTARSGGEVVLRFVEPDLFEVRLSAHPAYAAALRRSGPNNFDLQPVQGVVAVGGTGLDESDLWTHF